MDSLLNKSARLVLLVYGCILAGLCLLSACSHDQPAADPPPPPDELQNTEDNGVTRRQKIVQVFGTADIANVPTDTTLMQFIVRDRYGSIWYVSFQRGLAGKALLFGTNHFANPHRIVYTNTADFITNMPVLIEDIDPTNHETIPLSH